MAAGPWMSGPHSLRCALCASARLQRAAHSATVLIYTVLYSIIQRYTVLELDSIIQCATVLYSVIQRYTVLDSII